MRKNDWILAGVLLALGLTAFFVWNGNRKEGTKARISVQGKETAVYSLLEDGVYDIGEGNRIQIENGSVRMIWADCPDQLCVKQGTIQKGGESIVCLPHQVVVEIVSDKAPKLDGLAG